MNIIEKSITEVKPYEKNPRKNDQSVDKVANSIKEFGFKVPIVVDKNNIIVCGHTRYKAAKKLGLSVVPCVVADDLTEEQIKAYRLADNKVGEDSLWDMDLLSEELGDILDLDMTEFGFELLEDEPEEVVEDDFEAELPEEPKAKLGDIYQLGNHRLMCGDSTSVDDIDKLLNGNKVVLYLSDPPYGVDIVQAEKVGDTILDCFGGSGSTLIACEQLQRNCYMMEYEPHYIDVIIARWEQFTGKKAVLLNEET